MLRCQSSYERKSMAKIIKVGSQNPTFTSLKASSIQTRRNSNESTNPFKFTNFEGKTLPIEYADVFEGFKPQSSNKLRMIASSVTGSMNKVRTNIAESITNFVNRVRGGIANAWDYAKNTNISDVPGIKQVNDILNTPVSELPGIKQANDFLNTPIHIPAFGLASRLREGFAAGVEFFNTDIAEIGRGISSRVTALTPTIAFHGKQKYAAMSVLELEAAWNEEIAAGGNV